MMRANGGPAAACVYIKADGTIEARSAAGAAVPLAKASELQAVAAHVFGHTHASFGAPPIPTFTPPGELPGDPFVNAGQPGTRVIKGE